MTRYYLITIAVLTLYIGLTLPYTVESVRNHVAIRVAGWHETKAAYQKQQERDVSKFVQVAMPHVEGIN